MEKTSKFNWTPLLILAIVFGIFGAHRLYVGKKSSALAMFLLTISIAGALISFIWALVDLIKIILNKFTDVEGNIVRL